MKSRGELNQELRQRILNLSGVAERQDAGIHEDAFLSDGRCSCISMAVVTATFDCRKLIRSVFRRKARRASTVGPPEAGYVTFIVDTEEDLEPAMDLIQMSYRHFGEKQSAL